MIATNVDDRPRLILRLAVADERGSRLPNERVTISTKRIIVLNHRLFFSIGKVIRVAVLDLFP